MSKTNHRFGSINVSHKAAVGELSVSKSTVSQATAITSGVTLNSPAGVITSVSSTLATSGNATFNVVNSFVNTNSIVLASVINYSGSDGIPSVNVGAITQGSFNVTLRNTHKDQALNGIVKIGYNIF